MIPYEEPLTSYQQRLREITRYREIIKDLIRQLREAGIEPEYLSHDQK